MHFKNDDGDVCVSLCACMGWLLVEYVIQPVRKFEKGKDQISEQEGIEGSESE